MQKNSSSHKNPSRTLSIAYNHLLQGYLEFYPQVYLDSPPRTQDVFPSIYKAVVGLSIVCRDGVLAVGHYLDKQGEMPGILLL